MATREQVKAEVEQVGLYWKFDEDDEEVDDRMLMIHGDLIRMEMKNYLPKDSKLYRKVCTRHSNYFTPDEVEAITDELYRNEDYRKLVDERLESARKELERAMRKG